MSCQTCGREADVNGTPSHYMGCPEKLQVSESEGFKLDVIQLEAEGRCAKDGCTNPRAVSKGPRPAKYCTDHKTNRSK